MLKMEQKNNEENEVQKSFNEAVEPFSTLNVKEESEVIDFEDIDPLGISPKEEFICDVEAVDNLAHMPENLDTKASKLTSVSNDNIAGSSVSECLVCGKSFSKRKDFLTHKMNSHKVSRPYGCKICKKRFAQEHCVALHMRVHTGECLYKCFVCSKTFTRQTNFTIHKRIHKDYRPYTCDLCGKRLYNKSDLTSHMKLHTNIFPHKCDVCGRLFICSKSMLVHRRSHTGVLVHRRNHTEDNRYKCQYCGMTFSHVLKYKNHTRRHTGEKPYSCKVCGKGFPRSHEVRVHMHSHQGIKSFQCIVCNVYCVSQESLSGHVVLHHSDSKAPQSKIVYKPNLVSLNSAVDGTTNTSPLVTKAQKDNIFSKQCSDGKPKLGSYKDYLQLQEKILIDKGLKVRYPQKKAALQGTCVPAANCSASTSKNCITSAHQKQALLTNNGKQIMILSSRTMQTGGRNGLQLVLPGHTPAAVPDKTIAPVVSPATDQQFVSQPPMVLSQPQILGKQQLIALMPTGTRQNVHRLVFLPKQASAPVGGQTMVIPSVVPVSTNAPLLTVANLPRHVNQQVIEPSLVPGQSVPISVKQEPGVQMPSDIVIKQEPKEIIPLSSSGLCNVVIKQEPQGTPE